MPEAGAAPGRARIWIEDLEVDVPADGTLLHAFQSLSVRDVTAAGFCWSSECCSCEVDLEVDGRVETVLSCETRVRSGMRIVGLSPTVKFALRGLRRPAAAAVRDARE